MKRKKNKTSFADLAKRVISKYKRRLGDDFERYDPMSVDALNRELEALMQQQEETRAKMLEADQVKMRCGGKLRRYGQGGKLPLMQGDDPLIPSFIPYASLPSYSVYGPANYGTQLGIDYVDQPTALDAASVAYWNKVNSPNTNRRAPLDPVMQEALNRSTNTIINQGPSYIPMSGAKSNLPVTVGTTSTGSTPTKKDRNNNNTWWSGIPTEAKVGALAQGLGVIGSGIAALANRPEDLKYTSVAAPKYTPVSDEEAIRQAQLAYQDAARSSRGLSPGRYYSQMGQLASGRAGATAGIAERIANINAQGMNQNAWQAAQLGLQNQRMKMITDQYNQQRQDEYGNIIPQTIAGLAGTVAGGARDALAYRTQKETLPYLGQANFQVHSEKDGTVLSTHIGGGFSHYLNKDGEIEYFEGRIKLKDKDEFDRKYQKYLESKSSMSGALPGKKK